MVVFGNHWMMKKSLCPDFIIPNIVPSLLKPLNNKKLFPLVYLTEVKYVLLETLYLEKSISSADFLSN